MVPGDFYITSALKPIPLRPVKRSLRLNQKLRVYISTLANLLSSYRYSVDSMPALMVKFKLKLTSLLVGSLFCKPSKVTPSSLAFYQAELTLKPLRNSNIPLVFTLITVQRLVIARLSALSTAARL